MNSQNEDGVNSEFLKVDRQHRTSISKYKSSWKQFDGDSSHLLINLCTYLAGTQYEAVTKDLVSVLGPVFGCGDSELVLGRLKEMDNLLSGLNTQAGNKEDNVQVMFRCLLLFVKLQAEYHQLCSAAISSVIEHLISTCDNPDNHDLVQQMKSLNLGKFTAPRQSPSRSLGFKKSSNNTGSPKTQKQSSFKASLFSLFERKNSQEEGNSSFYVDIDNPQTSTDDGVRLEGNFDGNQSTGHMTVNNQSDVLVQVGMDPCLYGSGTVTIDEPDGSRELDNRHLLDVERSSSSGGKSPQSTGSPGGVATQEELNSVINLLSGVNVGLASLQLTPDPRGHMTLQVPSPHMGTSPSPASSDSSLAHSPRPGLKSQQRHSEGSIDLSAFGNPGSNTWPYHHRASLPGGQLTTNPHLSYDYTSMTVTGNYGNDLRPMTLPAGGAGHYQTGMKWGFTDSNKLNRTWPVNNLATSGLMMDTMNSTWSGFADSDDHSDDSSCDHQFLSTPQFGGDPRQYSEDYMMDGRIGGQSREIKHHSLEDLLEGRSNTWPQQLQPWSSRGMDPAEVPDHQTGYHRPVQMQRSDPLSHSYIWHNSGELQCQQPPPTVSRVGHM